MSHLMKFWNIVCTTRKNIQANANTYIIIIIIIIIINIIIINIIVIK